jgi:hypothetical protein
MRSYTNHQHVIIIIIILRSKKEKKGNETKAAEYNRLESERRAAAGI